LEPLLAVAVYAVCSAANKTIVALNIAAVTVVLAIAVRTNALGTILKIGFAVKRRQLIAARTL
jgi:hypothetical protein